MVLVPWIMGSHAIARAEIEETVDQILAQLTLEEKVGLCHGSFDAGGVPRLGIGQIRMLDGRQGLRPMDERTLREAHLFTYEMAVREGKVWSMMSANSLLNGIHCAHKRRLLAAVKAGEVPELLIDDKARRILWLWSPVRSWSRWGGRRETSLMKGRFN